MNRVGLWLSQFADRRQRRPSWSSMSWDTREGFYRHMSGQLRNDVAQVNAVTRFQKRLMRRRKPKSARVMADLVRQMEDGMKLSVALRPRVPNDEALILLGGENAGKMPEAFELIVDAKNRMKAVRRTLVGALTTPVVYLVALYGLVWAIGMFVLPSIEDVLPESKAQGMSWMLYQLGDGATNPLIIIPMVILGATVSWIIWSLPNYTGKYRVRLEEYFPFNFYRDIQGFTWILTFSSMLVAGMADTKILGDQARYASPWLKQRLIDIRRRMTDGAPLARALIEANFGFPSPDIIDDIESMAEFTDFAERISFRARSWADELQYTTQRNVKLIGFICDIVMYGLILFVLIGINSMSSDFGSVSY